MEPVLARFISILGITLCAFGLFAGLAQSQSSTGFRVPLRGGELNGFRWELSATGSKERPLKQICAVMSEIGPRDPDVGFVESSETSSCGSLLRPSDSISLSAVFGTDESNMAVLRAALYPRDVHRVTFVLAGGEKLTYRTRGIEIKNRKAKGIPFFRSLVAQFSVEACLQQVISYDAGGHVIKREKGDEICPQGA
jgi:hypothetical protein